MIGGWVPEPFDPYAGDEDDLRDEMSNGPPDEMSGEISDPAGHPEAVPAGGTVPRVRRVRYSPGNPWGRLAKRWVPETLRDSRVDPGKRGALLLTLVAAVAALVAAVGVWRDRPEPRPVQAVSLAQVSDSPTAASGQTSRGRSSGSLPVLAGPGAARSTTKSALPAGTQVVSGQIVVSVTGAVRRPGLVELPAGSRVADAIDKAGGATAQANLTGLNLAQKLTDGASVVVSGIAGSADGSGSSVSGGSSASGGSGESASGESASGGSGSPPVGGAGSSGTGKVDLNTADVAALDALPGVGPVTAAAIVTWREKNGRFTSLEQLQEIPGIGPAKYATLAPLVTV